MLWFGTWKNGTMDYAPLGEDQLPTLSGNDDGAAIRVLDAIE